MAIPENNNSSYLESNKSTTIDITSSLVSSDALLNECKKYTAAKSHNCSATIKPLIGVSIS